MQDYLRQASPGTVGIRPCLPEPTSWGFPRDVLCGAVGASLLSMTPHDLRSKLE